MRGARVAPQDIVEAAFRASKQRRRTQRKIGMHQHSRGERGDRQQQHAAARVRMHEHRQRRRHRAQSDQAGHQRVIAHAQADEHGRDKSRSGVLARVRAQGQPQGAEGKRGLHRVHLGAVAHDDDAGRVSKGQGRGRRDDGSGLLAGCVGNETQGPRGVEHEHKHQHRGQRTRHRLRQRDLERHAAERQQGDELGEEQGGLLARRMRHAQAKGRGGQLRRIQRVGGGRCGQDIGDERPEPHAHGSPQSRTGFRVALRLR